MEKWGPDFHSALFKLYFLCKISTKSSWNHENRPYFQKCSCYMSSWEFPDMHSKGPGFPEEPAKTVVLRLTGVPAIAEWDIVPAASISFSNVIKWFEYFPLLGKHFRYVLHICGLVHNGYRLKTRCGDINSTSWPYWHFTFPGFQHTIACFQDCSWKKNSIPLVRLSWSVTTRRYDFRIVNLSYSGCKPVSDAIKMTTVLRKNRYDSTLGSIQWNLS
jgi:hypothetical protein